MKIGLIARSEYARGLAIQRFEQRVEPDGDCWRWVGYCHVRHGYGMFHFDGGPVLAHRWAYETFVADIPVGLVLDHLCRHRWCVNPAHLEPVTIRVNVARGIGPTARYSTKTECPKGHPYDERNTYLDPRGGRHCRRCRADRSLALYYERKAAR